MLDLDDQVQLSEATSEHAFYKVIRARIPEVKIPQIISYCLTLDMC